MPEAERKELSMKIIKRLLCFLLAMTLFAGVGEFWQPAAPVAVKAATVDDDIFVDNENGTVKITFTAEEKETILILVDVPAGNVKANTNEAVRYYYKLSEGKNVVNVPLTRGEGDYKIRICKVLDTGKASVLKTKEVKLTADGNKSVFDVSNLIVSYKASDTYIKKAKTLVKKCKTESAKVKKIYNYIISNYAYDYELLSVKASTSYYSPSNLNTYNRKLGICYDISALFSAMLRSVGIEARVVTGYTPNVKEYHAWTQVWDSKKKYWYTIDATYDMCLYNSKSKKKYTMIKKDSEYSDIVYMY